MKIQCDVCNKEEASVFCTADEAALCDGCDHRVHHANKLASKHQRFSLLRPSPTHHPLCDICQEKKGFMFCQQDRAILCKDCDFSIHSVNEHTKKHSRFLLTGVKLSDTTKLYSSSSSASPPSNNNNNNTLSTGHSNSMLNSKCLKTAPSASAAAALLLPPTSGTVGSQIAGVAAEGGNSTNSTSSISEYLIETIPGWQVEDFLDSNSLSFGFSKSDEMLAVFDADIEGNLSSLSTERMGIWVPQAPSPPWYPPSQMDHRQIWQFETKDGTANNIKGNSRSRLRDDSNFIVPQICPDSNSKRQRFLW